MPVRLTDRQAEILARLVKLDGDIYHHGELKVATGNGDGCFPQNTLQALADRDLISVRQSGQAGGERRRGQRQGEGQKMETARAPAYALRLNHENFGGCPAPHSNTAQRQASSARRPNAAPAVDAPRSSATGKSPSENLEPATSRSAAGARHPPRPTRIYATNTRRHGSGGRRNAASDDALKKIMRGREGLLFYGQIYF